MTNKLNQLESETITWQTQLTTKLFHVDDESHFFNDTDLVCACLKKCKCCHTKLVTTKRFDILWAELENFQAQFIKEMTSVKKDLKLMDQQVESLYSQLDLNKKEIMEIVDDQKLVVKAILEE